MKTKLAIALVALAMLCVCAIAQEKTAEDWYKKGRELGRNGSYEEAASAYNRAIELEPNNATFYTAIVPNLNMLAFTTNNQSKRNESLEAIDKALEIDPKNPIAWEQKGSMLSQMQRYNESLEAYDKAIENISSYRQDRQHNQNEFLSFTWTSKSISLWQLMRYNESLEAVDRAVQIDPAGNYDAWAFKGELLASLGRYNESLQAFEGAAATETASSQPEIRALPWAAEGYVLMQMGRYEEADRIYQKIIGLNLTGEGANRRLANAWRGRGNALAKLGEYNESLQAFDKAIELNAEMAPYAWTGKGDALKDAGRYDEALQAYDESLKLYPEYADAGIARAWKGKGDVLIKTDRLDEALAAYDNAVVAYDEASMAFNNATPIDKAVSFTFDPYPLDGEFWYDRGYALWSLDRDSEANSAFEKARSMGYRAPEQTSPTDSLSITNVTSLGTDEFIELIYTGNETQSFKNLRLVSENESIVLPDFTLEPGGKIRMHLGSGATNRTDLFLDREMALDDVSGNLTLKDLATGVEKFMSYWTPGLEENAAGYWIVKGDDLFFNKSNPLEALESYEKAIQIDPDNMTAWNGKSMALEVLSMQTYSKILNLSEAKLAKNPQDVGALQISAMALASLGSQEESNQFLKKAIDIYDQEIKDNPKNATAWFLKAGLTYKLNGSEEAISAYDRVIELNGSKKVDALITKGNILLNLGRYDESLDAIDKAIQSDPENPAAWYEKAIYSDALGKYNESLDAYEMITKLEPEKASAWWSKGNILKALGRQNDADAAYAKAKELGYQG